MYHSKASDFYPQNSEANRNASRLIPFVLAIIYGAMIFQTTTVTTIFLSKLSLWDSLHLVTAALSIFAAFCLWPMLIRFGNGATISDLRSELNESENTVRLLRANQIKLNGDIKGYENELSRSYRYFRNLLKTFDMATFYSDMDHKIEWAYNFSFNNSDIVGKRITDVIQTEAGRQMASLMQKAIDCGEIHEGEIEVLVNDELKHYFVQVAPRYDRSGSLIGSLCVSKDVTEKAKWHEHLSSMTLEVNHRARNLLAIVVSLLGQTAKSVSSVTDYRSKILTRVSSLAKSIDLITQDSWTASSLRKLVEIQIKHALPNEFSRIHIDGKDIALKSKAIQNVGLAIHELSTNSEKFGALSTPDGQVELSWKTIVQNEISYLRLNWKERWADSNLEPLKKGFGLSILEKIVAQELGGKSQWSLGEKGMEYEMTIPSEWIDV